MMKFLSLLILSPALISASFFSSSPKATTNDDELKIPGENPLHFCENPIEKKHILVIEKVDLEPNPPRAGETLNIKATGNFTEEIEDGAYVKIVVKIGKFPILRRTDDLCLQMKQIDKECPLQKGETTVTKSVDLPSLIPPGVINVEADVYTADDKRITCLVASVQFNRRSAGAQLPLQEDGIDL